MTNTGLNQTQMSALMPWLNPVINIIVERVTDKLLEAIKPKEPKFYSRAETAQLLHVTLPTQPRKLVAVCCMKPRR